MFAKDTSHRTVFPVFTAGGGFGMKEMEGAADVLMVPDPTSFRVLPWSPATGWLLCDVYFADGRPVPFATRNLYKTVLDKLAKRGYDFVAGLEVECHIFKLDDPKMSPEDAGQPGQPPSVSLLSHGYQYLTEQRYDQMEPVLDIIRRDIQALGLPLRSIEVEFGPSQCEFTFQPTTGLEPADNMILFRSAVKQIARRHGYHATFMCRPKLPNVFASGWHLHQSLVSRGSGENAFMSKEGGEVLSAFGRHYLAGLLQHARASAVFTTPTINGYKRYRSYSLAPDRAIWGRDNRGVMIRVLGGANDPATRLENRIGEPAANPYLYMASQILSGLDGVDRALDPGPSADTPYETKGEPAAEDATGRGVGTEGRSVLSRGAGRGICRLLRPHQECGNRAVSGRGLGLGTARIFRDVLKGRLELQMKPSLRAQRSNPWCRIFENGLLRRFTPRNDGGALGPQIPRYRCCRSGSAINCSDVPLHTARPRSMM